MDTLKNSPNTLLYFSNSFDTIGITIQNGYVKMTNKDESDIIFLAKFSNNYDKDEFKDFHVIDDKLCIKYKIKSSSKCFSKTTSRYIAFITYNNDPEHKATYKLTVYDIHKFGIYINDYEYYNTYYSYFA